MVPSSNTVTPFAATRFPIFPENALELNELAIKNGVTAVVDCGVAPGMGNIILGHYDRLFQIENFTKNF